MMKIVHVPDHLYAEENEAWMLVDARIPDPAGVVIAGICGLEDLPVK
jgi:hypothetical protein